ncbi:MAG: hypothetical protein P1V51_20610 [Deltaproteobacteria bacterium]|nr:hypothetical protein [Deltaproteobacteria bacterium]
MPPNWFGAAGPTSGAGAGGSLRVTMTPLHTALLVLAFLSGAALAALLLGRRPRARESYLDPERRHGIINQLAGIDGMIELLQDTKLDEDQRELVEGLAEARDGLRGRLGAIFDESREKEKDDPPRISSGG